MSTDRNLFPRRAIKERSEIIPMTDKTDEKFKVILRSMGRGGSRVNDQAYFNYCEKLWSKWVFSDFSSVRAQRDNVSDGSLPRTLLVFR
jgi:hypothetical protein